MLNLSRPRTYNFSQSLQRIVSFEDFSKVGNNLISQSDDLQHSCATNNVSHQTSSTRSAYASPAKNIEQLSTSKVPKEQGDLHNNKEGQPTTKKGLRGYSYFRTKTYKNHQNLDIYELRDQDIDFLHHFNASSHRTTENSGSGTHEQKDKAINTNKISKNQIITEGMMEKLIIHFEKKSTRQTTATKEEIRSELPKEFQIAFQTEELDQFYEYWRNERENHQYFRLSDPFSQKEICPFLRRYWRASADEKGQYFTFRSHQSTRMLTRRNARSEQEVQEKLMQLKNEFQKCNELAFHIQMREYLKREIAFVDISDFNSSIPGLSHQFSIKNKFCSKELEIKSLQNNFIFPNQSKKQIKQKKNSIFASKKHKLLTPDESAETQQTGRQNISFMPLQEEHQINGSVDSTSKLKKLEGTCKIKDFQKENTAETYKREQLLPLGIQSQQEKQSETRELDTISNKDTDIKSKKLKSEVINESLNNQQQKSKKKKQKNNEEKDISKVDILSAPSLQKQENYQQDEEGLSKDCKQKQEIFQAPQSKKEMQLTTKTTRQKRKDSSKQSRDIDISQDQHTSNIITEEKLEREPIKFDKEEEVSQFLAEFLCYFKQKGIPINLQNINSPEEIIEANNEMQQQSQQKLINQNIIAYQMRQRLGRSNRIYIDRLCENVQQIYGEQSGGLNYLLQKSKNEVIYNTFDYFNQEIINTREGHTAHQQEDKSNLVPNQQNGIKPNDQANKVDGREGMPKRNIVIKNPYQSNSYFIEQQKKKINTICNTWMKDNMIQKKRKTCLLINESNAFSNKKWYERQKKMMEEYDSDTPIEGDEKFKKSISSLKQKITQKQKEKEKIAKMQQKQIQDQLKLQKLNEEKLKQQAQKEQELQQQQQQDVSLLQGSMYQQEILIPSQQHNSLLQLEQELDNQEGNPQYFFNNQLQFEQEQLPLESNYSYNQPNLSSSINPQLFYNQSNSLERRGESYDQRYLTNQYSRFDPEMNEFQQMNRESQIFNNYQSEDVSLLQSKLPKPFDEQIPCFYGDDQYNYNQDEQNLLLEQQPMLDMYQDDQNEGTIQDVASHQQPPQQDNLLFNNNQEDINDYLNNDENNGQYNTSHKFQDDYL